jgi:aryl-alcohol dehydrogenase-like predicted oxidoreductase
MVPIPGTKLRSYLKENVRGVDVPVSSADIERLGVSLAPDAVAGPLYNDRLQAFIDR